MKINKFIVCLLLLLLTFSGCSAEDKGSPSIGTDTPATSEDDIHKQTLVTDGTSTEVEIGDTSPISRSLAAKMISLLFYDMVTLETMDREITLTDSTESNWFDKYVNYVVTEGHMDTSNNLFNPDEPLTIYEAQQLLSKINPDNSINIKITDDNKNKSISYALWCKLYLESAKSMAKDNSIKELFGFEEITVIPLASSGTNASLPDNYVITDNGPLSCEGLSFDMYIDKKIRIIKKDNEVISAISIVDDTPVLESAYISSYTSKKIKIFCGGAEREYDYKNNFKGLEGKICNIQISAENIASEIEIIENSTKDVIKQVTYEDIELSNNGSIKFSANFKVYSIAEGEVKWKHIPNLIVGSNLADIYIKDNQAIAAVIKEKPTISNIRVAIKTSDFSNFYHENVIISASKPFKITTAGVVKEYPAGEKVTYTSPADLNARAYIEVTDNGLISIDSITRSGNIPKYRGTAEISSNGNGFIIINELPLEEYLYSVVPSEMPTSYGLEALKAQAVTARSYAYNQYYGNIFHEYGANVCDSVISQVYNNIPETELSIQSVEETKGQCLMYDSNVISANFFSTSSGVTANNADVWANAVTKVFASESTPYLQSKKQYDGTDYGDLTIEENAAKFLKDQEINAYDSSSNWFRWNLQMTNEELTASINANIKERYLANPKLIKSLQDDGSYKSRYLESIGNLTNIEVAKRGQGGNIMTLKITGTEKTILVDTEYNIRTLLRPKQSIEGNEGIVINRSDGSKISDYGLMPSAFFTMERMTLPDGTLKSVKFFGGGNGHGVGMSQVGVKGMVDEGFNFTEILSHFYEGATVEKVY